MKTWEMIKNLSENPNKKFISNYTKDNYYIAEVNNEILSIVDSYNNKPIILISLKREWEEVKKPVSFMDILIQAKKDNAKLFTIKNPAHDVNFIKQPLYFILSYLSTTYTDDLLADILLNSVWYIEDDEND